MKTRLVLTLALLAALPASAQTLRPQLVNGVVLGGVAGAIIGHNSGSLHHNAWRGAAFGAGTGLLLGALAADAHDRRYGTQVPVPAHTYLQREPVAYYGDSYDYGYTPEAYVGSSRPNYAGTGLLLGALAGGVIGHNSGDLRHNGWRGAAWGGAAGLLLGSVAEHHARQREAAAARAAVATTTAPVLPATPAPAVAPAVPAAEPAPASAMADANTLFGRQ